MNRTITLATLTLAVAILAGCSEDSTGPGGTPVIKPQVGNQYTYSTAGENFFLPDSVIATVVEEGITIGGKEDVYRVALELYYDGISDDTSSLFLRYLANGDVEIFDDLNDDAEVYGMSPLWITLPFTSPDGITVPLIDTTFVNGNNATEGSRYSLITANLGAGTATVGEETLETWKALMKLDGMVLRPGFGNQVAVTEYTYTLAPKIGFFSSIHDKRTRDSSTYDNISLTLTSYSLK